MGYFIDVVNFVDAHILWVVALFLAATIVELIAFLIKKKSGKFDSDVFFVFLVSNLVVIFGLYILACLGVGVVNCLKDQDWNFWSNYKKFLGDGGAILFGVVFVVAMIVHKIKRDIGWIGAAIQGAITTAAAFLAGYIGYMAISLLIILLKVLWFVISGFFISIFQFITKYWKMSVAVLVGPGVIYGAGCALANYARSFKHEVAHK